MTPSLKWTVAILFCFYYINSEILLSSASSDGCGTLKFKCNHGDCINRKWRCDGSYDCSDKSDELHCKCSQESYYDQYGLIRYRCVCPQNYFNCSTDCIPKSWACDGSKDCEDGSDEAFDLCVEIRPCTVDQFQCANNKCVDKSVLCDNTNDCTDHSDERCWRSIARLPNRREMLNGITAYYKNTKTKNLWGEETPRVLLALYFSDKQLLNQSEAEPNMIIEHLDILIALSLLRNATEDLMPTKMAIYIQSLLATCLNPRHFFGFDLVKRLNDRMKDLPFDQFSPTITLALCNAGETIDKKHLDNLRWHLNSTDENPMQLDMKAQVLVVLGCLKKRNVQHVVEDSLIQATIEEIKAKQDPSGGFVTLYTTALVVQAMMVIEDNGENWNFENALKHILSHKNLDGSFGGNIKNTYVVSPILAGKTLLDIPRPNCEERRVHTREKLGEKYHITYSLWIGDNKDVIHTIGLRVTAENTILDMMTIAAEEDPVFKMEYGSYDDSVYIYSINNIQNDPEHMMYWRLYQMSNATIQKVTQDLKVSHPLAEDYFIMWYSSRAV